MVINGQSLVQAAPIEDMLLFKVKQNGVSHGLAEVGYDIRIKQDVWFLDNTIRTRNGILSEMCSAIGDDDDSVEIGRFRIASAIEEFKMPDDLVGIVHDKSTWARKGLSVFNTVIEPGWRGFLTLELAYHGNENLHIPAGSGIAQVVFHRLAQDASYTGKYQDQADKPVPAAFA